MERQLLTHSKVGAFTPPKPNARMSDADLLKASSELREWRNWDSEQDTTLPKEFANAKKLTDKQRTMLLQEAAGCGRVEDMHPEKLCVCRFANMKKHVFCTFQSFTEKTCCRVAGGLSNAYARELKEQGVVLKKNKSGFWERVDWEAQISQIQSEISELEETVREDTEALAQSKKELAAAKARMKRADKAYAASKRAEGVSKNPIWIAAEIRDLAEHLTDVVLDIVKLREQIKNTTETEDLWEPAGLHSPRNVLIRKGVTKKQAQKERGKLRAKLTLLIAERKKIKSNIAKLRKAKK